MCEARFFLLDKDEEAAAAGSRRSSVGMGDKPMNMWRVGGCTDWPRVCPERLERSISKREEARACHVPRAKVKSTRIFYRYCEWGFCLSRSRSSSDYCCLAVDVRSHTSPATARRCPSENDVTVAKPYGRPHDRAGASFALLLTRWVAG